jgi:hypothetical protein
MMKRMDPAKRLVPTTTSSQSRRRFALRSIDEEDEEVRIIGRTP